MIEGAVDSFDLLELVEDLVDHSLLQCNTSGEGDARYGLYEAIRHYAWENSLQAVAATSMRHAKYFAQLRLGLHRNSRQTQAPKLERPYYKKANLLDALKFWNQDEVDQLGHRARPW